MLKAIPKEYHDSSKGTLKLLWEDEWRSMGITQVRNHALKRDTRQWRRDGKAIWRNRRQRLIRCLQSLGWEHYEVHEPEPHILLFKYVSSQNADCTASGRVEVGGRNQLTGVNRRPLNYQPPNQ